MFLLCYFLFLHKAYNNKNQEEFIKCQKQLLKGTVIKGVLKNFGNFPEEHLESESLLKLQVFRPIV